MSWLFCSTHSTELTLILLSAYYISEKNGKFSGMKQSVDIEIEISEALVTDFISLRFVCLYV